MMTVTIELEFSNVGIWALEVIEEKNPTLNECNTRLAAGRWQLIRARIRKVVPPALFFFAISLLFVRLTIRDSFPVIAPLYYLGQPVVLAAMFGMAALGWSGRDPHRWRWVAGACTLSVAMFVVWFAQSFRFGGNVGVNTAKYRAVTWNVMSGQFGWRKIFLQLAEFDADVIVLIEAFTSDEEAELLRAELLPQYQMTPIEGGLCVLTTGRIEGASFERMTSGGRIRNVSILLEARPLIVFAVDIPSNPLHSRRGPLDALAEKVNKLNNAPLLVAGDFNTPPDAVHYDRLRLTMNYAFESAGEGYQSTWPSFTPVLALDQFWVNRGISSIDCHAVWTLLSDHRPVILNFSM